MTNPETWRTMTALRESIKFYNDNNTTGKYNSALQKEKRMLKNKKSTGPAMSSNRPPPCNIWNRLWVIGGITLPPTLASMSSSCSITASARWTFLGKL